MVETTVQRRRQTSERFYRSRPKLLSIVLPLFNEEDNLPVLMERLLEIRERLRPTQIEVILIDDGSTDETFARGSELCRQYDFVKMLRFEANAGSHAAISAGLAEASGECAVFLAGDLQDPPHLIPEMLRRWVEGDSIVWAARTRVEGKKAVDIGFSQCYWMLVSLLTGAKLPDSGLDFALLDKDALDALRPIAQSRCPLFLKILFLKGLRTSVVRYVKQARHSGKSGWTLRKKLNLVAQTLVYAFHPMRSGRTQTKDLRIHYRIKSRVNC
ncbi:MAG TPA: glycosyltransferase family 2 protein [Candidatus Obscuribacterales bacterium]